MNFKWSLLIVFVAMFFLQGCATIKGAAKGANEGLKEDWKAASKWDGWMQDNLW